MNASEVGDKIERLRNERSAALGANDKRSLAGCTVALARDNGHRQTYRIVREDEADPARLCVAGWAGDDGQAGG